MLALVKADKSFPGSLKPVHVRRYGRNAVDTPRIEFPSPVFPCHSAFRFSCVHETRSKFCFKQYFQHVLSVAKMSKQNAKFTRQSCILTRLWIAGYRGNEPRGLQLIVPYFVFRGKITRFALSFLACFLALRLWTATAKAERTTLYIR